MGRYSHERKHWQQCLRMVKQGMPVEEVKALSLMIPQLLEPTIQEYDAATIKEVFGKEVDPNKMHKAIYFRKITHEDHFQSINTLSSVAERKQYIIACRKLYSMLLQKFYKQESWGYKAMHPQLNDVKFDQAAEYIVSTYCHARNSHILN